MALWSLVLLTAAMCQPAGAAAELGSTVYHTTRRHPLRRALLLIGEAPTGEDEAPDADEEEEISLEQPDTGSRGPEEVSESSGEEREQDEEEVEFWRTQSEEASTRTGEEPPPSKTAKKKVSAPRIKSSSLKNTREERKNTAAGLPERVPKMHAFGQASEASTDYLPRIFQDNFVGVKVSKDKSQTRGNVKTAAHKLQKTELGYVPGTATPHVRGLGAEHMARKTLQAFRKQVERSARGVKQLAGQSCALVGNSGLLKRTHFGNAIDAHDTVFRFNAAPTKGYEATAGSRTDVRIINNGMGRELVAAVNGKMKKQTLSALLGDQATAVWLRADERVAVDMRKALLKRGDRRPVVWMPKEVTYASLGLFHQYYAEELKAVMAAHPESASFREWEAKLSEARLGEQRLATPSGSHMFGKPSTGVSLIYLLKELCGSLDVYGFGTHDAEGNPGDYKYYDVMSSAIGKTNSAKAGSPVHSFDLETEVELAMANDGLIKYCQYRPGDDANNQHCSSVAAAPDSIGDFAREAGGVDEGAEGAGAGAAAEERDDIYDV